MANPNPLRYRGYVVPYFSGEPDEDGGRWEYTHASSIERAGRNLRQRFPWPQYLVRTIALDEDIREVKIDWEALDPTDLSAVLQEQKVNTNKCNDICGMRESLKAALIDEKQANLMYSLYSDEIKDSGLATFASALNAISRDEAHHQAILEIMLDIITEKCECNPEVKHD